MGSHMELQDSVRNIRGVGEKAEKLFEKLHIHTIEELLMHYPRAYDAYEEIKPVAQVSAGEVVNIQGTLAGKPRIFQNRRQKVVQMTIRDASGELTLTWFNMPFVARQFHMGTRYILRGKIERRGISLSMVHPQVLSEEEYYNRLHVMQPIYRLTAGLTNNAIRKAVAQALEETKLNEDYLPVDIRKKYHLLLKKKAIREIHFPKDQASMQEARRRLVFDEFFLFMLAMNQLKTDKHKKITPYTMERREKEKQFINNLPYKLTGAQLRTLQEIDGDMAGGNVMNRLIQGDVGSGKTVLALAALLRATENGYQGAMMVPTEVLAKQHYETIQEMLNPFGVKSALLVGSMKASEKKQILEDIASGKTDIIVGTHALIQEKVSYAKLALVVTDEQHRFGVRQREMLSEKGREPHMLVMSATPIPRTLAIILYGDLDISLVDELPAERLPIKNCVVGPEYRQTACQFIAKQVASGRQAYVICPMVEANDELEIENVTDKAEQLAAALPPSVRVGILHGKMKPAMKNQVMEQFSCGEIDVLVSTTVVEVGINVPNATVMMIENSERFGLAQLHQLRGRVGRGKYQSYCIFMAGNDSKDTMERLSVLGRSNDGFYIASEDLRMRGPGDMFGVRQSGELQFALADIYQDADILYEASDAAKEISGEDVKIMCKKYERLRRRIAQYGSDVFL